MLVELKAPIEFQGSIIRGWSGNKKFPSFVIPWLAEVKMFHYDYIPIRISAPADDDAGRAWEEYV
jgi:hypothetical protein